MVSLWLAASLVLASPVPSPPTTGPPTARVSLPGKVSVRKALPRRSSKGPVHHGMHARAGMVFVPNALLGRFLDSYTNSLCRGQPGTAARAQGAQRVGGCSFEVAGGYRWRRRELGVNLSVGYSRLHMPDGIWLGRGEKLHSGDYTQIRLHLVSVSAGVMRDFRLAKAGRFTVRWRLGGELGVGYLGGGIWRTGLGSQPSSCTDLGDLRQCRPFRPLEFSESGRETPGFADCDDRGCSEADLIRAGRQKERLPPVIPVFRLYTGPRVEIGRWTMGGEVGLGLGITAGFSVDATF